MKFRRDFIQPKQLIEAAARVVENGNGFQARAGQSSDFGGSSARRFDALPLSLHSAHLPFTPTLCQRFMALFQKMDKVCADGDVHSLPIGRIDIGGGCVRQDFPQTISPHIAGDRFARRTATGARRIIAGEATALTSKKRGHTVFLTARLLPVIEYPRGHW
jgi:hypothetical protein